MANARDLKRRIKSVKSTQQITKAMKMVSASKLRKSQQAVTAIRPFTNKILEVIANIGTSESDNLYLVPRDPVNKVCYIVIGSDRGLCGGFNGNLHRYLDQLLKAETRAFGLITIGKRLHDYCQRRSYPIDFDCPEIGDTPRFEQAAELAKLIRSAYERGEYDEVHVVYSEFKSAMSHSPKERQLLPVIPPQSEEGSTSAEYIFEPDGEAILNVVLPQYVEIVLYCSLQEAKASEHGARMTAMSSATDNASDMIDSLTLHLNRARQAAITTEITEIVGGAAALS